MIKKICFSSLLIMIFAIIYSGCEDEIDTGENALSMQKFVENISLYARGINPNFIIIPQNGAELAFIDTDPDNGRRVSYINAINGIGIEELFYNGDLSIDNERLAMLKTLKNYVKIMVSDYVSVSGASSGAIDDSITRNYNEGFIAFPRSSDNYDYKNIPSSVPHEVNSSDINSLADAKNYLYLINTDSFPDKHSMISQIAETDYDVVLIDLFFEEGEALEALEAADITALKTKHNGGKRLVISYISIGSAEKYRYYWQSKWKKGSPSWLKKNYEGYPDEFWVEYWNKQWCDIIYGNEQSYIKKIINAGFDGAYLDNVEAYYFLVNK